MAETFSRFDAADYLKTEADMAAYAEAAAAERDPATMIAALNTIARARSISHLARVTHLTREGIYKALSPDGNPSFATVVKIANAVGFEVDLQPIKRQHRRARQASP